MDRIKRYILSRATYVSRVLRYFVARLFKMSLRKVDTRYGSVAYFVPNAKSFARTDMVYTKEPETISWIDAFGENETLWDVGANIGMYTIYAAARPSTKVVAFEPSPANFAALSKSLELNAMQNRVSVYCIALNDCKGLGMFNMRFTDAGYAGAALNVEPKRAATFSMPVIGYTIDAFIEEFSPPFPNHLKIDVDGNDHLVLAGARKTLQDLRVKSVLVELAGRAGFDQGAEILAQAGFEIDPASKQARLNRIFRRASNTCV
jgi:FkbM family methyltransferase